MNRSTLIALLIILMIVVSAGTYTFTLKEQRRVQSSQAYTALSTNEKVASYTDLGGESLQLTDYAGKVLVVNAWASWCPFCTKELPALAQVGQEYANQDVVVLAINRRESKEQAERYLRQLSATEGVILILDPDDHFYTSIGGVSMPETVIYDRRGDVVFHKQGPMEIDEIRQYVEAALAVTK